MIQNRWRIVATVVLLGFFACSRPTAGVPPPQPKDIADANEVIWGHLTLAAKPEGKLVIATNNTAVRDEMVPAFSKRFGIPVEVVGGSGSDTIARVMQERAAGVHTIDVIISGLGPVASELHPARALASVKSVITLPDVADTTRWRGGKVKFADPDDEYVLRSMEGIQNHVVVNPAFASRDELRRSDDLLNPRFQGKIAIADPLVPDGDVVAAYFLKFKGEDFVKRLYIDQQPAVSRDHRQMSDQMASGAYPINLSMSGADVLDLTKRGIKLEVYSFDDIPPQTGAGDSFLTTLSSAPHPNATRLWVNWFASRDGQELAALAFGQPSNRVDVQANARLPEFLVPRSGREYFDVNDWSFSKKQADVRARMRALLGG